METRPPTPGRIAIAVGFAISCFALLLFLWLAFGGPVPLKPKSYRVHASFDEATQLAIESDIRISGVSVGRVKGLELGEDGLADATLEIDPRYAPLPADTRAILRQKTLLGETYVELTPGSGSGPEIPEDGRIPTTQISDAVQLDEIFRTFNPETREAFRIWMQDGADAVRGRGEDLSDAIGSLSPFTSEGRRLLEILDRQDAAVQALIRDGGEVFEALSERPGQLRGLIRNTNTVFSTTAARDAELAEIFRIFPVFLDESRQTLTRLETFAGEADPLILQLRPVANELSSTLGQTEKLMPELRGFFAGLGPVSRSAPAALGALRDVLGDSAPPLLERLDPFMAQLNPLLETGRLYRRELTSVLGNASAATNGFNVPNEGGGRPIHYLRSLNVFGPSVLAAYPRRLTTNRTNAYVEPGGYANQSSALESFETRQCTTGITATLDPGDAGAFPGDLFERLRTYAFAGELSSDDIPAPPCDKQGKQRSLGGPPSESTDYLHVRADP